MFGPNAECLSGASSCVVAVKRRDVWATGCALHFQCHRERERRGPLTVAFEGFIWPKICSFVGICNP